MCIRDRLLSDPELMKALRDRMPERTESPEADETKTENKQQ